MAPSAVVELTLFAAVVLVAGRVDPLRNVETVMVAPEVESLVETPTTRYLPPATPGHDLLAVVLAVASME